MPSLALIGPIGPVEIGIILLIVLIIFGPKRLPELGRSLGSGMRGFKDSVTGKDTGEEEQEQLDRPTKVDAAADEGRSPGGTPAGPAGTAGDTRP